MDIQVSLEGWISGQEKVIKRVYQVKLLSIIASWRCFVQERIKRVWVWRVWRESQCQQIILILLRLEAERISAFSTRDYLVR